MQNEISSKVSEDEVLPDLFFEDLLDSVDETLIPITYDKSANLNDSPPLSSLCETTTDINVTEYPNLLMTSKQFCNFPELTLGMEFSIEEALFPKEMNLEECVKDKEIISKKNKISEPTSSKLEQSPKAKTEQKLSTYNIVINSFVTDIKEISKENKNDVGQKQLACIKNRNDAKHQNTHINDCETTAQHKLIDSPQLQSKESDEASSNEQKGRQIPREVEIDDYQQAQNEPKVLNIKESELKENQPLNDENVHVNFATKKKCEGCLAESGQNDYFGSQCSNSKNVDVKGDYVGEKITEKYENIYEQNTEEQLNEDSDEYICILSEEYIVIQSDDCPDEQSEEYSDKQPEGCSDKQSEKSPDKQSEEFPDKQSEEYSDKQREKCSDKQSEKSPNKQAEKSPNKQFEDFPDKQSEEFPNKQSEEYSDKQPEECSDKQSEKTPDKQAEKSPNKQFEDFPDKQSEEFPDKQSEKYSDKQPEECSDKQSEKSPNKQAEKSSNKQAKDFPDKQSEEFPDKQSEKYSDKQPEDCSDKQSEKSLDKQSEKSPDKQSEEFPDKQSEEYSDKQPEDCSDKQSEKSPDKQSEEFSDKQSEEFSDKQSEEYSDKQPEDCSDKQSEKCSDKQFVEYSDKQSEDNQTETKVSKTIQQKRSNDSKQTKKDTHSKNQGKLKNNEEINSDINKNKHSNLENKHGIYPNKSEKESNDEQTETEAMNETSDKQERNSSKRILDTISKDKVSISKEVDSNESLKEYNNDERKKAKTENILKSFVGSSSKQTKRNSDTISKNKVTKFQEIYSSDGEIESNDKDEQTKSKAKNKLRTSDESSIKQTKRNSDIISKINLSKSKEIDSNESERESDDDYQETKSGVKKTISSEESSSKQNKGNSSKKKLTKSNEIYLIESEKESDYDEKQTKSKAKNKSKRSDDSFSNQSEKKLTKPKGIQLIDSDSDEYKQSEQTKTNYIKKNISPEKRHRKGIERNSNTPSRKRLIKAIETDSDESENKDSDGEQTKSNSKKKHKKSDKSSSQQSKKNLNIISEKKSAKSKDRKNMDSDGSENQVFEVDFEPEKSKAKCKLNDTVGNSCKISENQITQFERDKDSSERENAQSDAEDGQISFKAKKVKNLIEKAVSKNSRQEKLKSKKGNELEKSLKKQSKVPQTYKRKNKNLKENVSSLLKNNQLDDKDKHVLTDGRKRCFNENIKKALDNVQIEQIYSSQIKPCKIVLERLKNIDMYIPIKVPTSDIQPEVLKKQKKDLDKCAEKSKSKPEKAKLKGKKKGISVLNSEGTCDESVSRSDVEAQSNDFDSKILAKPKTRQYLDKHIEKIEGKQNVLEKGKNSVCDQTSKKTLSESKSKPDADKSEELKINQEHQSKKNVKKSKAKLEKLNKVQLKGEKNNASVDNNEETSSEMFCKPDTNEALSNDVQTENQKERELFQNQTEQSEAKLNIDSIKLKGKKDVSDHKETSSESVCNPETDESQSEALDKLKVKQLSKKLVEKSETKLGKVKGKKNILNYNNEETSFKGVCKSTDVTPSNTGQSKVSNKPKSKQTLKKHAGKSKAVLRCLKVKLDKVKSKGKKDVSKHNNEKMSSESVSELDTDEVQSDAGQSKVLDVPKNKKLLSKHAENSKSKLKKSEKVKLKEKKHVSVYKSDKTSSESESELDADKCLSEELKQKEHPEKPIEAKLDKSEKVKGDASEPSNEKTSSESVSELDTDEAQLDAGQSKVLNVPKNKKLLSKRAENSKSKLKKLEKVKLKGKKIVSVHESDKTSSESESELDADKSLSEKLKQKEHPEKPIEAKLDKSEKVKGDASEHGNEKTASECVSKLDIDEAQLDAVQSEVLDIPKDKQLVAKLAESSKSELLKLDKVKLKRKKDVWVCNSNETSSESESELDADKSQSEESKQKAQSEKPVEESEANLEKSKTVKEKKDLSENNNKETASKCVSKLDTETQSDAGQTKVLDAPEDKQILVKHSENSKVNKNLPPPNNESTSKESESEPDAQSEELKKTKLKQRCKKSVPKSAAMLKEAKEKNDHNNEDTSCEVVSKPDAKEAQSKAGQSEILNKPKVKNIKGKKKDISSESEFMLNLDEPLSERLSKSKQKQLSVKPIGKSVKGKRNESDRNKEETSGENESEPVSSEAQSKTLKKSKEQQNLKKSVVQSVAEQEKSEKVKGKKITVMSSDQCNDETSNEGVFKLNDADKPQTDDASSKVFNKPNDEQFLMKQAGKHKANVKKNNKIKFKEKEYISDNKEANSSESESVSDETQPKASKKSKEMQVPEKPVENCEKVKWKMDTPDHCNEETSNEGVLKLNSCEAMSNADQSLVLDEPVNKLLLGKGAEKSKVEMKKFGKVKFKRKKKLHDLNTKETLGISESESESNKSQSKQKQHSKKFFDKSNIKLAKLEKVQLKGGKNDAPDHIEIILSENDSKPDADEKFEKSETDYKTVGKNSFPKSKKRKFEHAEEIESLKFPKLKPCNVVIEQCDFSILENNITLQVPKKSSIVKEEKLTDISRNADTDQPETNASVSCEDENEVEDEIIYIVEDDEDIPTDITNNIQPDDSEEIDHSLSNCIVAVSGQHKKNASALKEKDEAKEKTSNLQSQDVDCNQSDYIAAVEDKCKNKKAKKTAHGEKEMHAEAPCNIQSQVSKKTSKANRKKSSKSIAESEKGNDLNEISESNSKGKDLKCLEKRQTIEFQGIEDCKSTVHGCEQSKDPNEKQQDSMNNSEGDFVKEKRSHVGAKPSENVELEDIAQSKLKDVSTNQREIKKKNKNSKLLNQNLTATSQGVKSTKSKEMSLELFKENLIISDENQVTNISDESLGIHSKNIFKNKSNHLSAVKPCSVILEKFGSCLKSNVDESDDFLSSNYEENSEDDAKKGKKYSSNQKRLSHVSLSSNRKHEIDISDEYLNSSCSDSEKSFEDKDVKYSKTKRQSNKLKQSSCASPVIKKKHKYVISDFSKDSDSSGNDFKGSSESEDVKDSRKKKHSNVVKPSSYASSLVKRKHRRAASEEGSSCSDSTESSDDKGAKDSKEKEHSNLLKPSSSARSPNERKCKRVASDEGSNCSDSKESSATDGKKLPNKLKQLCHTSSSIKKRKKVTSDSYEVLDSSCTDTKKSSECVKSSKTMKQPNKLKQFIRVNSSKKRKREKDTSDSDETTSCCGSSEESSDDENLKIKRKKKSYELKQLVRNLADDKIVRHISCKSCKLSFKTYRQWVKHDKEFHKCFVYKCDLCYGELFKSHSSYVNHMKYFHPYEKLFFCKYRKCKKSFSSLKKFRHHHKSHYKFMCKYCKEGFMKEYKVYGHVIKYHVK